MELHRSRLAVALALVAIVIPSTFSAPATRSTCAPAICRHSHESKLHYEEGKTYVYSFETEVLTQILGSTEETSKIKVKGQAQLAAQSSCDFVLTLKQVAIQSPSGEAISRVDDIEGSSLRFVYQDGEIESLCVSDNDPSWSSNVKRAVASMLVNNVAKNGKDLIIVETDISGQCPTTYSVNGNKYTKTRNLNSCTHRDGGATVFAGVPYETISKSNSFSGVDSTLTCEQEINNNKVFQTVSCVENHQIETLSTANSGVHTQIKSSLNLVSSLDGIQKGSNAATKKSSVFFDYSEIQEVQRQKNSATRAVALLNKLCSEVESGTVSSKVPGLFLQLKKSLKSSRKDDLKEVYDQITSGRMCSKATQKLGKLYLDAAASAGTDGPIAFVSEVIASGQGECTTKELFKMYTTFSQRPGVVALEAVESLISRSDSDHKYLLVASGLAFQYCKKTNPDCGSNNEYHSLVDKIAQHVRSASDEEGVNKVIAALQALGNLDKLTPAAVTAISNILTDSASTERLRVRALDAFRRDPCQEQLKQKALKIFGDIKESSQVRIQAYLTVTKCGKQKDVQVIQTILDSEPTNQVGSFVASHIENVVESASPAKQQQKQFFKQLKVPTVPKDMRKFSRNVELSTFSSNINLGASVDGNIIFSQDSFIPRSISSNVTVEAFGRSYNFLEVGIYGEDFEHLIEEYFGPTGKVTQTSLSDVLSEGSNRISKLVESVQSRFKREVKTNANKNEIESLREKIHIEERTGDQGRGDVYIRVLGTSISVDSFSEDKVRKMSVSKQLKKGFEKILEGAKDHKVDLTEPFIFVDDEVIIPTSSGLPLNLQLEGTTILSLQMQGNLDIASLFRMEGVSEMRAKIMPSAATVLKARMTVGTGPIESGLQMETKIHSSSGIDLKIVRENGKFEVRFNLPQDRTQIIDMRNDLYWVEQPQDSLEKKTPVTSTVGSTSIFDNECTTALSKVFGLKVCMDAKFPKMTTKAPFPFLNGPSVISLTMEKSESSMEGYYLKIEKDSSNADNFGLDILVDTPGSKTNRKVSASLKGLNYKTATPEYKFKLDSPWNKLEAEYQRSFTDDLKGVSLKVVSDGEAYEGKLQLKKTTSGDVRKYQPVIQYSLGGNTVNLVEGQVVRVVGKKVEIDLKTAGPFKSLRGHIKGLIELNRKDQSGFEVVAKNLEFASEVGGKIIVDGTLAKTNNVVDTKIALKYGNSAEHTLDFESKFGKPSESQCVLKAKTRSSRRAYLNFNLDWEITRSGHTLDHKLEYTQGAQDPKVKLLSIAKIEIESRRNFDIHNELTFKYPDLNIDFTTKAEAKASPGNPRHAELTVNANSFKSKLRYDVSGNNLRDYSIKATAECGGKKYEFTEDSTQLADQKQSFKTRVSVTPGFWVQGDTEIEYKFAKNDIESHLFLKITSDKLDMPINFKSGVTGKSDGYSAFMKLEAKGKIFADVITQLKYAKGSPTTLNMKAEIPDYLDAKLAQSLSRKEGNLDFHVKWIPTGRKIVANSKMTSEGEKYNIDGEFKWDADRDESKTISIKSITTLSTLAWKINSKNDVTIIGKTSKINIQGALAKEFLNGEDSLDITFTNSEEKTFNLATVLNLENKLKTKGGKINVKVTLPGEQPYALTYEGRVTNPDLQEQTFQIFSDLQFDNGEKDIKIHTEVGAALPGNYRSYNGKIDLTGSLVPQPISGTVQADVKKGKVALKGFGNRGTRKGDFDIVLEFDKWSPKKTLGTKYVINTPYDRFRNVEGEIKYEYFFNNWKNFEVSEGGSFKLNSEIPVEWKRSLSILNNEFKLNSEIKNEGKSVFSFEADAKLTSKQFLTSIESVYKGEKSFLKVDVDHEMPEVGVHIRGGSPLLKQVGTQELFEIKADLKKTGDHTFETDILAKSIDNVTFRVTNKIEVSPTTKSFDILVSASEEPTRRLYVLVNENQNNKYNVEALFRWGDGGKFASTKGDITRTTEAFDATMTFDSPELDVNKYNIKVSRKSPTDRHSIDIKVEGNGKEQLSAVFNYARKEERSGAQKSYEGSLKVKSQLKGLFSLLNFDGKFQLEDSRLDRQRDNEEGRQFRASFEVTKDNTPIKATAVAKSSDKEKRVQVSFCKNGEASCRNGDVHLRYQHESNGDLEYVLKIVSETVEAGQKRVRGVNIRTAKSNGGRQLEHTTKLIMDSDKEETVGYRIYRKDNEIGTEILLPERVISLILLGENPAAGNIRADLSFYIDKTKQPARKISLIFETSGEPKNPETGYTRNFDLIFKHPDLNKDLKIVTNFALGGERVLIELKTVLDVFKSNSEINVAYKVFKEEISGGNAYKGEWSVKSKGQNINFGGKSELRRAESQISYSQELQYENRENQMKTAKIEAMISLKRFSIEVEGPSSKLFSVITSIEKVSSGYEIRDELLLPGMEDAHIFQTVLKTTSPISLQIKTFTANTPSGVYYEGFVGFKDENNFVTGVFDHETSGKNVLAELTVSLKNNRILDVKTNWEKKNVKNVFVKAQKQFLKTGQNIQQLTVSSVEEVTKEAQFISTNLRKSSPNFKAMSSGMKDQWSTLVVELDANEDTKVLLEKFQVLNRYFKQYSRVVLELTKVLRRIALSAVYAIRENLETLPELLKQYSDKIPYNGEDLEEIIQTVVGSIMSGASKTMKLIGEAFDQLSAASPKIIERINWVLDISSDAGKIVREFLEVALVESVKCWKALRSVANDFLENESVKRVLKDVFTYVQLVVTEFIDESKTLAENLKNYILKALPQKEFQEIVEAIADYVEKKARNQPVDDAAAIRDIYEKLITVLKKVGSEIFSLSITDGHFLAKIPLPVSINSLSDLTSIFGKISLPSPPRIAYNLPSLDNFRIKDTINRIRNGASIKDILPPFDAYGLLIGSQYYKTFDGKFFRFDGDCQYLLASDFADGNFSVVVDYEKKETAPKKSLIVTDFTDTVALKPNNVVVVNGQEINTDNPVDAGSFHVERNGDWVVVTGAKGVKIGCADSLDVCAVKVNGFYHGKVLGLLGKFNQEPFDDLSTPEGEITEDIFDLAKSWKIESQCNELNIPVLHVIPEAIRARCASAFDNKSSSLSQCYGVVDPKNYQSICENLSVSHGFSEGNKGLCAASLGYSKACKMSFAPVEPVQECRNV